MLTNEERERMPQEAQLAQLQEENGVLSREEERLEDMIVRAAGFLEVPEAFENRVQDFEFWLDSPPSGDDLIGKLQTKNAQLEEEIRVVSAHAVGLQDLIDRIREKALDGLFRKVNGNSACDDIVAMIDDEAGAEAQVARSDQKSTASACRPGALPAHPPVVVVNVSDVDKAEIMKLMQTPEAQRHISEIVKETNERIRRSFIHEMGGKVMPRPWIPPSMSIDGANLAIEDVSEGGDMD